MILFAALSCTEPARVRYDGHTVVQIAVSEPEDLDRVLALRPDVWSEHVTDSIVVRLDPQRQPRLDTLQLAYVTQVPDLGERLRQHSLLPIEPGFYGDWRDLDEIEARLIALAEDSPQATLLQLGTSVEGRPVWGVELGDGSPDPGDRLGIVVNGLQHAREWVSASSASYLAERLADGYGVDPEATAILDGWRVLIVPVVNPDGYRHTWTTDRLWRKNRRDNGDGTYGVDLNRNWDAGWGGPGSSSWTSSVNYRGPAPFSEPETAAIRDFLRDHPRYARHIDLHCTGQFVLYPWGSTPDPTPDDATLAQIADGISHAIDAVHGSPYQPGPFNTRLYPASGVAIDWSYTRGMQSYLIELRDRGHYGFLLPPDQILPTAEEAWAGFVSLVQASEPPRLWLQADDPIAAGATVEIHGWRASQGEAIEVWWSTDGPGTTPTPGGTTLEQAGMASLGIATADAQGHALLSVPLPPGVGAGDPLALQAISDAGVRSQVLALEVY